MKPNFAWAYRKHNSTNHVLINLIKNWKKNLDNFKIIGAIFIYQKLLIAYLTIYVWPKWSLWLQWGLSFFVFIPEASRKIRKHKKCAQFVPNSTLRCPKRICCMTTALQHFFKWPVFQKKPRGSKFCRW